MLRLLLRAGLALPPRHGFVDSGLSLGLAAAAAALVAGEVFFF